MTDHEGFGRLRISKIADRYLVFDADHAALLRRSRNICGVLVGSTPQNPTQNVFLSLPLELFPEEVAELLKSGLAALIDQTSHHLGTLQSRDKHIRLKYMEHLQQYRWQAKRLLTEDQAMRTAQKSLHGGKTSRQLNEHNRSHLDPSSSNQGEHGLSGENPQIQASVEPPRCPNPSGRLTVARPLAVTPTASSGLPPASVDEIEISFSRDEVSTRPLHGYLLSKGYFMTPGLRFGADYSVYPGDPLRYHAHFLASEYGWDEEICMLDIVGGGRLGTSVKKGFLIGGECPTPGNGARPMRAFSIEWAGM
ncbi:tRNA-intron endonuclease catalytic domain-like protein [Sodiomyces alkalinus F11]|uniref:tRNA-splicing endonuclease subunit Sen34 n=1 Tax=Sodiomyces alkalinus (strain CBS 110278 / VKM F-3762 / F11) TaxID=1314773 RepID=A0A3N2PJY9_SODAK|nr:tRNA-intron endonuclease catalytic domain-like protein [Sodiomyces alkalinus F11]ROT34833.1 tRNA-intron endonuclease catalytic domain-like protein [Sodiomyces alkalinus F11]